MRLPPYIMDRPPIQIPLWAIRKPSLPIPLSILWRQRG